MIIVKHEEADQWLEKTKTKGSDIRWDGWNIKVFIPAPGQYYRETGVFRNGQWGREYVAWPRRDGTYHLPEKVIGVK